MFSLDRCIVLRSLIKKEVVHDNLSAFLIFTTYPINPLSIVWESGGPTGVTFGIYGPRKNGECKQSRTSVWGDSVIPFYPGSAFTTSGTRPRRCRILPSSPGSSRPRIRYLSARSLIKYQQQQDLNSTLRQQSGHYWRHRLYNTSAATTLHGWSSEEQPKRNFALRIEVIGQGGRTTSLKAL